VHILGAAATVEAAAGNLSQADEFGQRAFAVATDTGILMHVATADALAALGRIERERNNLDRAAYLLDEAIARANPGQRFAVIAQCRIERALLELARRRPEDGLVALSAPLDEPPTADGIAARAIATEVQLQIAAGQLANARTALRPRRDLPLGNELHSAAVQLACIEGDIGAARTLVDEWPTERLTLRSEIERDMWTGAVDWLTGDEQAARHRMAQAVTMAEPEALIRLFADGGPSVMRVIRSLDQIRPTEFLRRVLDAGADEEVDTEALRNLVVPLTARELAVLRLLPGRLSNAEIAAELYVSLNTIKTHLKHIYQKLAVADRRDAITAAEAVGLL
jgi:LuxR family maltose regulon positive regulatory protein